MRRPHARGVRGPAIAHRLYARAMVPTGPEVQVRAAVADDAAVIHRFIEALAVYENEPDAVEVDVATLREQLSSPKPPFEALIADLAGEPVGFALYFANYSTWTGRVGVYLEDLFVPEEHRRRGIGTALLRELARITLARGGARLDWQVLDWNEPAIRYYESVGAAINRGWLPCRLQGEALTAMASR